MTTVAISASLDDLRSRDIRFLYEASRLGEVHVLLWSDQVVQRLEGRSPKFPQHERLYFAQAIRYVKHVTVIDSGDVTRETLPSVDGLRPDVWAMTDDTSGDLAGRRRFCQLQGLRCEMIASDQLAGFPVSPDAASETPPAVAGRKKVLVTGTYDWLHTGHVRFFEEVSEYGDLYVAVGHDANIELLKGPGHPQFREDERRYVVQSIRYVKQALITSGNGWLDAEPELRWLKPDMYIVNEDGDKPEKRAFCQQNAIEYVVLKRLPKPGLPRRQSTALRGF